MNRSEDNTCEHCLADLPRHVVGKVFFCSQSCFEASEGPIDDEPRDAIADLNPAACTLAAERAGELCRLDQAREAVERDVTMSEARRQEKISAFATRCARRIFDRRGNNAEVHLSESELSAIIEAVVQVSFDEKVHE